MKGSVIDYVACTPEVFAALLSLRVLEQSPHSDHNALHLRWNGRKHITPDTPVSNGIDPDRYLSSGVEGWCFLGALNESHREIGTEYLQTLVYMKSKSFVMTMSFLETGQRKHSDFYTALSAMLGVDVVCASTGRPVRGKAVRIQIMRTGSPLSRGWMTSVRLPETSW